MVRVHGPMMSVEASGSIGDVITFQKCLGGHQARRKPKPPESNTPAQQAIREKNSIALAWWQWMQQENKELWRTYRDTNHNQYYWAFMSKFIRRSISELWQWQNPAGTGFCNVGDFKAGDLIIGGGYLNARPDNA